MPQPGSGFGRLFYRLEHAAYGEYTIVAPGSSWQGPPPAPRDSTAVLSAAAPEARADLVAAQYWAWPYEGSLPKEHHDREGVITAHVVVNGGSTWDDDIVVVADNGGGGPLDRAWAHLLLAYLDAAGHADLQLQYLLPGSYVVKAYALGASDSEAVRELGRASIELALPPLDYTQGGSGHKFWYQPAPAGEVQLTINLQDES